MRCVIANEKICVLRFDPGEEVIAGLITFCEEKKIRAASFTAIGLSSEVMLSYYRMEAKKFEDHKLTKELEIVGMNGNVSVCDEKTIVHAHGTFSDENLQVVGGHIKRIRVSLTCEVSLHLIDGEIKRTFDPIANTRLMQ